MNARAKAARTIAGLYNAARPLGMGFLQYREGDMSPDEAGALADRALSSGLLGLDYHHGRVMKIGIDSDGNVEGGFALYDRDNGAGAGERAVADGLTDPQYACLDGAK